MSWLSFGNQPVISRWLYWCVRQDNIALSWFGFGNQPVISWWLNWFVRQDNIALSWFGFGNQPVMCWCLNWCVRQEHCPCLLLCSVNGFGNQPLMRRWHNWCVLSCPNFMLSEWLWKPNDHVLMTQLMFKAVLHCLVLISCSVEINLIGFGNQPVMCWWLNWCVWQVLILMTRSAVVVIFEVLILDIVVIVCHELKNYCITPDSCHVLLLVLLSLSHVVSWVRCGTWLYQFLIFALFLTFTNECYIIILCSIWNLFRPTCWIHNYGCQHSCIEEYRHFNIFKVSSNCICYAALPIQKKNHNISFGFNHNTLDLNSNAGARGMSSLKATPNICSNRYSWFNLQTIWAIPTMWYVRPAKAQTSLRIHAGWSETLPVA